MRLSLLRSCDQVSGDLPVEIMLNIPKCSCTTNNLTNNPTTNVDEIRSVTFNKNLDRMGNSKRKQKAILHRERKENAINTCRLEIQKVIVFTNINILVVFIHSNQVIEFVEFEGHRMMQLFHSFILPQFTVVFAQEHHVLLHLHHAPYQIITQM
jgi:hypothetical protein